MGLTDAVASSLIGGTTGALASTVIKETVLPNRKALVVTTVAGALLGASIAYIVMKKLYDKEKKTQTQYIKPQNMSLNGGASLLSGSDTETTIMTEKDLFIY